ncbi:MAG: hypothetical protein A4E40_01187 [Methanoregulaceae archaeon PtaU1.Bin059]|nr:MAG: hypothetical protein A4E40_01187 [Methanoregulaceae archaeon PtaU1.Bin059]
MAILIIRWEEHHIYTLVPAAPTDTCERRVRAREAGKKVHSSYILQSYKA